MRYAAAAMLGIAILTVAWWPESATAEDTLKQVVDQNVVVAYQPPQASAEALLSLPSVYIRPGSLLYWAKHLYEQVQLVFTADPEDRSALMLKFSQQRLAEGYQAAKEQDWSSAKAALVDYQQGQTGISNSLQQLQQDHQNIDQLLNLLKDQLGIQQALNDYVSKQAPPDEAKQISALLLVRPNQNLALVAAENGSLLGIQSRRQATQSAQQASTSASPSATPTVVGP